MAHILNKNFIEDVVSITRLAGHKIQPFYLAIQSNQFQSLNIQTKKDASVLTQADLEANRFIVDALSKLNQSIPIISEEMPDSHVAQSHTLFWLVDPLDGTKEFISRSDEFTVNIALIQNHRPILGVIYLPALDSIYWGAEGFGSYSVIDGVTKKLTQHDALPSSIIRVIASKNHLDAETSAFISSLNHSELFAAGSSYKFCKLAEGGADLYPRFNRTCAWDIAAGHAILKFAGGSVVDLFKRELEYCKGDVFNTSFIASRGSLDLLGVKLP
jgi:3'(2'), 5'-bisphosphate nucleotidase